MHREGCCEPRAIKLPHHVEDAGIIGHLTDPLTEV